MLSPLTVDNFTVFKCWTLWRLVGESVLLVVRMIDLCVCQYGVISYSTVGTWLAVKLEKERRAQIQIKLGNIVKTHIMVTVTGP